MSSALFESVSRAVIIFSATGLLGVTVRWLWRKAVTHSRQHEDLSTYPDRIEQHHKEHEEHVKEHTELTRVLTLVTNSNVAQLRTQMINIHERAMGEKTISMYWKSQFYALYENYKAMGGNGFVEQLKQDIDNL